MRLVTTGLLAVAATSAPAQPVTTLAPGETLLSVEAEGEALSRPDMMVISAGAVTAAATSGDALRENAALVARMVDVVRRAGIEPRDVRTSGLRVEPRMQADEQGRAAAAGRAPRILGYVVENRLEVRFRDLGRASEIMEALFASGANSVSGPRFSLQDPAPARRTAERDAAAQARLEADNYAAAFGKRVSRILRISERRSWEEDGGEAIVVTGSRIATPIEPGELATRSTIFVDFALVDS